MYTHIYIQAMVIKGMATQRAKAWAIAQGYISKNAVETHYVDVEYHGRCVCVSVCVYAHVCLCMC
jgi:hypothetical protein